MLIINPMDNANQLSQSAKDAKRMLKDFKIQVEPVVQEILEQKLKETSDSYNKYSVDSLTTLKGFVTRGGKRLRASFVYYVYKMYGGKDINEVLKLASAIDIVHSYLLIIDDFMDRSAMRRGAPTVHEEIKKKYKDEWFFQADKEHFSNSVAVPIGSAGFHIAMQILNNINVDAETKVHLSQNLNRNIEVTFYGQITDVFNAVTDNATEEDVLEMLKLKTGVYTYENPIHTGAIMAGVTDEKELEVLSDYAIPAGIAFQIQDDVLGVFGDEGEIGKSNTDDLKEAKYTLLVHKVFELGDAKQKEILRSALGNRELTKNEHSQVKKVMEDSGSLTYSQDLARKLVKQAKNALVVGKNPNWQKEGVDYLNGIADYMIERKV